MAVTDDQLKKLAELKIKLRKTDLEVAEHFGVSQRTIQRWLRSSAYGELAINFRADQLDTARQHVSGMADEIIVTMRELMLRSKSDLVRMQSAATLGKWLGLDEIKDGNKGDDKDELRELLQMIASKQQPPQFIPPPLPGGALPDFTTFDAEYTVVDSEQAPQEKEEGE